MLEIWGDCFFLGRGRVGDLRPEYANLRPGGRDRAEHSERRVIRGARIQRLQRAAVEHTLSTPPLECWFEYKNTYSASRARDMGRYGEIWGDIRLLGPATALSAAEMPPCPATPAEHDGSGDAPPLPPTPAARPYRLPRHFLDTSQTLHRHLPRGRAGCLRAGPASRAPLDRPCRRPTLCRAATRRWPAAGERCLRGGRRGQRADLAPRRCPRRRLLPSPRCQRAAPSRARSAPRRARERRPAASVGPSGRKRRRGRRRRAEKSLVPHHPPD